jgi:hypothetical protein
VRHPAHESFRSARCCSALTSSAPFCPHCKMFWPVGFRKLRRPLTETCLPKLVQPNVRYVSTLCASVEISTNTMLRSLRTRTVRTATRLYPMASQG